MMAEWRDLSVKLNFQFADPEIGADTGDEHGSPASAINGVAICQQVQGIKGKGFISWHCKE